MPRPINKPAYFENITYKIIGAAFAVHKELGPIHKEPVYQKALENELVLHEIDYKREVRLPVTYKGKSVGVYIPDFIIDNKVILEVKALPFLPITSSSQLSYYLKSTGFYVGLLINFGATRLQVRRRIYGSITC